MGRVRVASLNFSIETLQSEVDTFRQKFVADPGWMTQENHEQRRALVEGLTFLMLNLSHDVDQDAAWELYHTALDEYHEICDRRKIRY